MLRCTRLILALQCVTITTLILSQVNALPIPSNPNNDDSEGKLGMADIASMTQEAILGKMVLPDDTQQAKDTKSVIAQYIFSLVQQDGQKKSTTGSPEAEKATDVAVEEADEPETTPVEPVTLKATPKAITMTTTTRTRSTARTTEEPDYEEEEIEKRNVEIKAQEATDAIQDIINAAIFQAQAEEPTTTTTTQAPTTVRRRRRSTTMRMTSTTPVSDYYDEETEETTTLRRRTYRPARRTTRNPDSGVTGWVPETDDDEHEFPVATPASANPGGGVLNEFTKLLVNVGTANVSGVVDQSLKIASVETVGSVLSGVFNLFMCTPLDQLVGRCKQTRINNIHVNHPSTNKF